MNKILVFISLGLFVISCESKYVKQQKKIEADLQTYFIENLKDSTATLDSFFLVKIDTISQRSLFYEQSSALTSQLEYLVEIIKLNNEGLGHSLDQIRLYRLLESPDLVEIEKRDFEKKKEKSELLQNEADTVLKIINTLNAKVKTADSIKPVGMQAKCLYQVRFRDKSIERDTSYILLNTGFNIVRRKDFLNIPYNIDFDKFD